jgi:hypothetical protein
MDPNIYFFLGYREDTQQIHLTLNLPHNSDKYQLATPVELVLTFMLSFLDYFRIRLATLGNRCDKVIPMAWATLLCCPAVLGYVCFLKMHTPITPFDKFLNMVPLSFIAAEFSLGVLSIIVFQRKKKVQQRNYQSSSSERSNSLWTSSMELRDPHE